MPAANTGLVEWIGRISTKIFNIQTLLFLWCCCNITKLFSLFISCQFFPRDELPFFETYPRRDASALKQTVQSEGGVWGWSLVLCVESLQDILFGPLSQLSAVCTVCSHQWAHLGQKPRPDSLVHIAWHSRPSFWMDVRIWSDTCFGFKLPMKL